jgi:ABC-2 type transport system permease protein
MFTEFKHTLRRLRGQVIGWSIGIALYGLMMVSFYGDIAGAMDLVEIYESFPSDMVAFFGDALTSINTPWGYLDTYFFNYMTVILGIFAVSASASLVVGDEEKGILDLTLAHPISRTALFSGRLLGLLTATLIILCAGWLSWLLPSQSSGLDLTWIEFLRPFLPLLIELLLFGTLALLLSMLVPAGRMAAMITGALLVANYLLLGLSNINEDLKPFMKLTPLYYYQGGRAIEGINWPWAGWLFAVGVLFTLLAWWRFRRRDIRVGGEGGWRLSGILFWRRRRTETA